MVHPACATATAESLAASANKLRSRLTDMTQLAQSLRGPDEQHAWQLTAVAVESLMSVGHIRDLVLIKSLVENDADKRKIEPIIRGRVKAFVNTVDSSIRVINADIATVHNQAVIATAGKLKDDLRELKEDFVE